MDFVKQRCDDMLFQMTNELGKGCEGLMDAVFGFLFRRTDFFYVMEPGGRMGFPPGVAENMVSFFWLLSFETSHMKTNKKQGVPFL